MIPGITVVRLDGLKAWYYSGTLLGSDRRLHGFLGPMGDKSAVREELLAEVVKPQYPQKRPAR
jgi:hypothetical protein